MKKVILSVLLSISQISFSQSPAIQWAKSFGGSLDEGASTIQQTSDGGYILTGYTNSNNGNVSGLHGGNEDFWVVKLDNLGILLWQKCLGGSGTDLGYSIQQTSDGGYILAGSAGSGDGDLTSNWGGNDAWIVKLNSLGAIVWQRNYGSFGTDFASSIKQTTDGGYVFVGSQSGIGGDVTSSHGNFDYWVVKIDNVGAIQWQKPYGGSNADFAYSVQQTSDGGYIVAGDSYSSDGDIIGFLGNQDYWIVKLDALGALQWQKSLGGGDFDYCKSIQQTSDGGYIVAGYSSSNNGDLSVAYGGFDCWIVKLNSTGGIQWQKSYGGSNHDFAYSVQQTSDGGYIIGGATSSNDIDVSGNHLGTDFWVVQLNSLGAKQWQKCLGGSWSEDGFSILQTTDGGFAIAGNANSVNFDVLGNHGGVDYWVVKLSSLTTGVQNRENSNDINIYPNPTIDHLNISGLDKNQKTLLITNILGEVVNKIETNGAESLSIDTKNLTPGVYFIKTDAVVFKFLKE